MNSDPEQERQRLAHLYSGMTPEELENVAADAVSLTDVARETLKAEISGRGLAVTVSETPTGVDTIEERDLVMIRRFQNLTEALLAKGSLDSSGIECFLTDDNMVRMDWFISNCWAEVSFWSIGKMRKQPPPFWMNPPRNCWMSRESESISNLDVLSVNPWMSTSNN
jgi:hypothetical protein